MVCFMTVGHGSDGVHPFKERVKREREHEILDAARDVFASEGFQQASVDSIAERVGIAKGTVYLHFSGKEEILLALLRRMAADLTGECQRVAGQCPDAPAKLRAILEVLVQRRLANGSLVRLVRAEVPRFLGSWRHETASEPLRSLIAGIVEQGKAEGSFDPRIDARVAGKTLLMLVFMTDDLGSENATPEKMLEQLTQLYFHGITKEVHDQA